MAVRLIGQIKPLQLPRFGSMENRRRSLITTAVASVVLIAISATFGLNPCFNSKDVLTRSSVVTGGSNDNEAEQLVGPERGERVSQLNLLNRRLDVNAAPGQL